MIICAAIRVTANNIVKTTQVVCGRRHGDCWSTIKCFDSFWLHSTKTEGFIDHKGNFLTRQEAFIHARECGQVSQTTKWKQEDEGITELYSEDLW